MPVRLSGSRLRLAITPGGAAMTGLALVVAFLVLYPVAYLLFGSFLTAGPGRTATLTLRFKF